MATHRAHNLFHTNPVHWLGEIKRQDPRLPSRLLLVKGIKETQNQKVRWPIIHTASTTPQKLPGQTDPVMYLSSPVLAHYPAPVQMVLQLTTPTASRAALPKSEPSPEPLPGTEGNKPSADQLLNVYNSLQTNLPRLFTHAMDYRIYSQDVLLVNNVLNKTTQGLFKYVQQVALLRIAGHLKFAYVKLELISMSQHPMEGRITVKWRVVGISGLRVMLKFWKFKLWKWQEMMKHQEVWYDVISHFDVGTDGLVYKHTVDRVEEDKEQLELGKPSKSPLLAKLALIAALFPRNELGEALTYGALLQSTTTTANTTTHNPLVKGKVQGQCKCQAPIQPSQHDLI